MAATTEKRTVDPMLTGYGRNIFRSHHINGSPMAQLRISPHSSMNSHGTSELPSPDVHHEPDDTLAQARSLARDYIKYKVDPNPSEPRDESAKTLRRIGDELVDRHQTVVNATSKRLQYSKAGQYTESSPSLRMFKMIANQISEDGQENWGRVATLFVLGSILALNNMEKERGEDIENIIEYVGTYVGTEKKAWIERNGGWAGFVKFFDNGASEEKKVWKGLLYAGLGLGAIASLAASRH